MQVGPFSVCANLQDPDQVVLSVQEDSTYLSYSARVTAHTLSQVTVFAHPLVVLRSAVAGLQQATSRKNEEAPYELELPGVWTMAFAPTTCGNMEVMLTVHRPLEGDASMAIRLSREERTPEMLQCIIEAQKREIAQLKEHPPAPWIEQFAQTLTAPFLAEMTLMRKELEELKHQSTVQAQLLATALRARDGLRTDSDPPLRYTLTVSEPYPGLDNTYESLQTTKNSEGAGTSCGPNSAITAILPAPVTIRSLTVAAGLIGGWTAMYINGAQVQISSDGSTWTTLFTVEGVAEDSPATFPVNHRAQYLRLYRPNGWLGTSRLILT